MYQNIVSLEMSKRIADAGWRWKCACVYVKHKAEDPWKLFRPSKKRREKMEQAGWYILDAPGFDELMTNCEADNFHFFKSSNGTYVCRPAWGGAMFIDSKEQESNRIDALGNMFCREVRFCDERT